jgi:nucleotide-binding universal stress UspA family protein
MKKILVPTDFSEASQWAVEVATGIAQKSNAEIILLHVVEEPTKQSFSLAGEWELDQDWEEKIFTLELIRRSKKDLNKLGLEIQDKGIVVSMELKVGNPYHGISTVIGVHQVDLVVMGTFGHTRLERIFLGSNTEKVIRRSKCPVLTVYERPVTQLFKNIVYATCTNTDETGFSKVLKIAQQLYDSTIHLVRINTPSNFVPDRHIKKSMQAFADRLHLQNYTLNIFSDTTEEEGILNFAESIQADLIGLTTHARSGFVHLLTGSVSEGIVNYSKTPVLTYLANGKS